MLPRATPASASALRRPTMIESTTPIAIVPSCTATIGSASESSARHGPGVTARSERTRRSAPRRLAGDGRKLGREILARVDVAVGLDPVLAVVELPVAAAEREELRLGAPLHDLATLEHEDLVGARDGREPVRDHERRAPLAEPA